MNFNSNPNLKIMTHILNYKLQDNAEEGNDQLQHAVTLLKIQITGRKIDPLPS